MFLNKSTSANYLVDTDNSLLEIDSDDLRIIVETRYGRATLVKVGQTEVKLKLKFLWKWGKYEEV